MAFPRRQFLHVDADQMVEVSDAGPVAHQAASRSGRNSSLPSRDGGLSPVRTR
jgi:hypothetical protein